MLLVRSTGVTASNDLVSRLDSLNAIIPYFKCIFALDFDVVSNGVTNELSLSWRGV